MKESIRILIIGNSGSGKTWLGKALSEKKKISLFQMDGIKWDQNGYEIPRSSLDIGKNLEDIKNQEKWILEVVFGKMAQNCLPFTDHLIWLDLPWEQCQKNLLIRGPQFENILNNDEKEKALKGLIECASTHYSRNDANSSGFFDKLYIDFNGKKTCFKRAAR